MGIEADRDVGTPAPGGVAFWTAVLVGWGVIAFGVVGVLADAKDTHPRSLAIWIVGSLAFHDLLIAPLVFFAAGALRRTLSRGLRAAVQAALITSAMLAVISVPVIGRFGAKAGNPTLLPRDYGIGLLVALGVVWTFTALTLLIGRRRSARRA